ncbi:MULTISPECIES: phosphomevalonate kinase [Leuconostoc]|uniref:phosphomevalonate kinase n=2 Tax=Leuconostoc kimchii TaxID=136609 RepID=D5T0Q3_LEUKI|nr:MULTISPECIES: phosphomevalonate kinase [Leuconostoc]ADG39852.1 phosphomevalonate kinase [Leuconostoc kimchii IMSNU 11154]AEJ30289.1 phosphomevalonate kinase [Leuconostoc sp. C2]QBR47359.1 phosphomevalonate kinase [Leuconostoc kimchii]
MTKVNIPGKLFLAGEYAITHPGNTAIIATITTGLTIEIQDAQKNLSVAKSNTITKYWQFQMGVTEDQYTDDWRYVRAAIKLLDDYVTNHQIHSHLNNVNITISSHLNSKSGKIGLGSSAAVVVGIIEALDRHFHLQLPILTRFKLAGLAHLHVQKNGSLGDIAAITYGGIIAYQSPDLSLLPHINQQWLNPDIVDMAWPSLDIISLPWPVNWQILLGATHESADTKVAISHTQLTPQFLSQSQQIVQELINTIIDVNYHKLTIKLRANQTLLTNQLPTGYVTPKLAFLLTTLGDTAGKISGAGFGDNGFAILNSHNDILANTWKSYGIDAQIISISPQKRG